MILSSESGVVCREFTAAAFLSGQTNWGPQIAQQVWMVRVKMTRRKTGDKSVSSSYTQ